MKVTSILLLALLPADVGAEGPNILRCSSYPGVGKICVGNRVQARRSFSGVFRVGDKGTITEFGTGWGGAGRVYVKWDGQRKPRWLTGDKNWLTRVITRGPTLPGPDAGMCDKRSIRQNPSWRSSCNKCQNNCRRGSVRWHSSGGCYCNGRPVDISPWGNGGIAATMKTSNLRKLSSNADAEPTKDSTRKLQHHAGGCWSQAEYRIVGEGQSIPCLQPTGYMCQCRNGRWSPLPRTSGNGGIAAAMKTSNLRKLSSDSKAFTQTA